LGLFHHPLLKLFHGLLYCVLYFCVHLWFMANSICDSKQTGLKGIRRRIWSLGSSCAASVILEFFFFLFFSFDSFAGLVEQCAWNHWHLITGSSSCWMSADDESVGDQFKGLLALQEKGSSDSCRCRIQERELASCTYWSTWSLMAGSTSCWHLLLPQLNTCFLIVWNAWWSWRTPENTYWTHG
jgi:hypothetical protein